MKTYKLIILLSALEFCFAQEISEKCSIEDSECQKYFFGKLREENAENGIPAIGIPPLDPMMINTTITVMDLFNLTLIDGVVLGIKNCSVLKYVSNVKTFTKDIEILCDRIVIQGQYVITSNKIVPLMLKGNIDGCGYGSIVIEDWYFKLQHPFEFVKRDDGQIYMQEEFKLGTYEAKVLKSLVLRADNIYKNDRNIARTVVNFINRFFEFVLKYFGGPFNKKSMEYYYDTYKKFFENIPATEYLSDDLTKYLQPQCNSTCD